MPYCPSRMICTEGKRGSRGADVKRIKVIRSSQRHRPINTCLSYFDKARYRGGSSHKDSKESLITLKKTYQLLICTPSQWYSCMSRPSRSTLEVMTVYQKFVLKNSKYNRIKACLWDNFQKCTIKTGQNVNQALNTILHASRYITCIISINMKLQYINFWYYVSLLGTCSTSRNPWNVLDYIFDWRLQMFLIIFPLFPFPW